MTVPKRWRKATRSQNTGTCVEVALHDAAHVRDSKDPGRAHLTVHARAWAAFVADVKSGR